jgi:hypothetical protein
VSSPWRRADENISPSCLIDYPRRLFAEWLSGRIFGIFAGRKTLPPVDGAQKSQHNLWR